MRLWNYLRICNHTVRLTKDVHFLFLQKKTILVFFLWEKLTVRVDVCSFLNAILAVETVVFTGFSHIMKLADRVVCR